jgi:hypothetical protein
MANGNQSGFGTPGTQQTAQKNVQTGGVNPNMPVGQQLAKQGASSYQQSLTTGGASPGVNLAKAAYSAPPPIQPMAPPSPLAGFPYKESLGMNASLGFSNEAPATMPEYTDPETGGDLESTFLAYTSDDAPYSSLDGDFSDLVTWSPPGKPQEPEPTTPPDVNDAFDDYVEEDQPGIDPDEYAKMQQANVDDAEVMYQQGLQSLARQYAMMGMTGSGAHMVANNALGVQIHRQLVQAQNVLALENARIMEEDYAEKFDNAVTASELFTNNALKTGQIDHLEVQTLAATIGLINNELGQNVLNFMEELGYEVTATQASQFNHVVSTALGMDDPAAAAQWASEQFSNILSGTGVEGWESPAGYADPDTPFKDTGTMQSIWDMYNESQTGQVPEWSIAQIEVYVLENGRLPKDVWKELPWGELEKMYPGHSPPEIEAKIVKAFGGEYTGIWG